MRGTNGRPTTAEVTDPQAAKEARIREIFTGQRKLLAALFPKDGETMVARAVSSAILASRARDKKTGEIVLARIPAEAIAEKVIAAHHMGLEPGTECYLIPYGGNLELQIGPQGLIKLMMNTGMVRKVEARAVRGANEPGGDVFDYDLGDEGFIKHKKGDNNRDYPITHAYAFIETTTGGRIREVLTAGDLAHYRSLSKMRDGGPMWQNHPDGAARKTAIHRIAEFVPRSPVVSAALRQNEFGGVEVDDEIMRILRENRKGAEGASNGAPPVVSEVVTMPAGDAGREEGQGA